MGRELRAMAAAVAPLILLDRQPPHRPDTPRRCVSRNEVLVELVNSIAESCEKNLHLSAADPEPLTNCEQVELLHRRLRSAGMMPSSSRTRTLEKLPDVFTSNVHTRYECRGSCFGRVILCHRKSSGRMTASVPWLTLRPHRDELRDRKSHDDAGSPEGRRDREAG
jgi:hypothetical protein